MLKILHLKNLCISTCLLRPEPIQAQLLVRFPCTASRFPKDHCYIFQFPSLHPFFLTIQVPVDDDENVHWCYDNERRKAKYSEKDLCQCHFVHHKSRNGWPWRINATAMAQPSEAQCSSKWCWQIQFPLHTEHNGAYEINSCCQSTWNTYIHCVGTCSLLLKTKFNCMDITCVIQNDTGVRN